MAASSSSSSPPHSPPFLPSRISSPPPLERTLMSSLRLQLSSLASSLPHHSHTSSPSAVVLHALRYKKVLKRELQTLQRLLPYARQVKVVRKGTGLQIKVSCKKKSGLLIALMEVLESSGLVFSRMRVNCEDGIAIKALSKKVIEVCVGKGCVDASVCVRVRVCVQKGTRRIPRSKKGLNIVHLIGNSVDDSSGSVCA